MISQSRMEATRLGDLAACAADSKKSPRRAVGGERGGVLRGEAVLGDEAGAAGFGELGHGGEDLLLPLGADDQRRKVGLGEVAVVVGLLLAAHGIGAALGVVPQARLLHDAAAVFEDADLALDLVLQRSADVAEAVDVLDFGLGAVLRCALQHDADVRIAAQGTLFHVAVGDAGIEQDFLELGEVLEGLVGCAEVGLGDDLDQRRAAAVEVDVGARGGVGKAVVEALAGVLFHVQARDADALRDRLAGHVECGHDDHAVFGDGLVELRDLVALGRVGIEVVLAGEDAGLANLAADGLRREHRELDGLLVEQGQRAGQAEADGADVGVGFAAVLVLAAAEGLGFGEQLDVDLQADDGLVLGEDFRRECEGCGHALILSTLSALIARVGSYSRCIFREDSVVAYTSSAVRSFVSTTEAGSLRCSPFPGRSHSLGRLLPI